MKRVSAVNVSVLVAGLSLLGACAAPRQRLIASSGSYLPLSEEAPPAAIRKERISGELPHLSAIEKLRSRGEIAVAYRICVDKGGAVASAEPAGGREAGLADADRTIAAALRTWRYRPQPLSFCFVENLRFLED